MWPHRLPRRIATAVVEFATIGLPRLFTAGLRSATRRVIYLSASAS